MPIDFRLRDYCMPLPILRLRRELEVTQFMDPEERAARIWPRLRRTLQRARDHVPYYRERLAHLTEVELERRGAGVLADLARTPADALRDDPERLLARDAKRFGPQWERTSGSSGFSRRFVLDRGARALEFCYYWRHWSWAGYRLFDRFAELGTVHFVRRPRLSDRITHWQPALRRLMINATRVTPDAAPAIAAAFRTHRPRFLKGMASALDRLARVLADAGVDDLQVQAVFTNGDLLTAARRRRIAAAFHAPVLDSYGHMERTVAVSECLHGGRHVHVEYGVLELLEERRDAAGVRLGRVTGTSLHNLAMPLIRYDVGDDLELAADAAPCPCGRTLPLVGPVHGRSEDTVVTPDGRFLTAWSVLFDLVPGIACAQALQDAPDRVHLLVVPDARWNGAAEGALRTIAARALGPATAVRVSLAAEADLVRDPSGKVRAVVGRAPDAD